MSLREFIVANALAAVLGFVGILVGITTLWEPAIRGGLAFLTVGISALSTGVLFAGVQRLRRR